MPTLCSVIISLLLLFAAIQKALDLHDFHIVISTLTYAPDWAKIVLPPGIPIVEAGVACLVLWPGTRAAGLTAAGTPLIAFTLFLVSRTFDPAAGTCHCMGRLSARSTPAVENAIGAIRNVVLLGAVCVALSPRAASIASQRNAVYQGSPHDGSLRTPGIRSEIIRSGELASRRPPSDGRHLWRRRQGVTLIEVLVTVAILGLTAALSAPALVAARRAAQRTACANNLHTWGVDASVWAANHRGYLPLDGQVAVPDLGTARDHWPASLNDADRLRYAYHQTPTEWGDAERPLPFFAALLAGALPRSETDAWTGVLAWSPTTAAEPAGRRLRCPAVCDEPSEVGSVTYSASTLLLTMPGEIDGVAWDIVTDYGTNGGLLGFDADPSRADRRYAGLMTRGREAATLVLATDAAGRFTTWVPAADGESAVVTLADALAGTPALWDLHPTFDRRRHGGRVNVLLLDGHVACVDIDARSLAPYRLLDR